MIDRRHFLHAEPRAAAGALVALSPELPDVPGARTGEWSLLRLSRRAMATTFEIAFPIGTPDAWAAADEAFDLIDEIEGWLTVYRPDSEVSRVNAFAADAATEVEPELFALLEQCSRLHIATGRAFDAAQGALTEAWGFSRRAGRVPTGAELAQARKASGMRHVILDAQAHSVKFRVPGVRLNFGAVGKGYALDRAAELLRTRWGVRSALLQAGGSSVLAVGAPPGFAGWPVALRHPGDLTRTIGVVSLNDRALGTSAATFQHFEHGGKRYGHLIDPRSGVPAAGAASASCLAPMAAEADALSTALFVRGPELASSLTRPELGWVYLADAPDALPVWIGAAPRDTTQ